jgi:hypothetical protein
LDGVVQEHLETFLDQAREPDGDIRLSRLGEKRLEVVAHHPVQDRLLRFVPAIGAGERRQTGARRPFVGDGWGWRRSDTRAGEARLLALSPLPSPTRSR